MVISSVDFQPFQFKEVVEFLVVDIDWVRDGGTRKRGVSEIIPRLLGHHLHDA